MGIKDPVIDDMLQKNRAETDPAKKEEYAKTVNDRFAEQCYNLWGSYTVWGVPHRPGIEGIGNLPTDPVVKTAGLGSRFDMSTVWISN